MFVRIRCQRCHLSSLWTDDPEYFLRTVCLRRSACEAKLVEEEFCSLGPLRGTVRADEISPRAGGIAASPSA
jgi:hypothetical protein